MNINFLTLLSIVPGIITIITWTISTIKVCSLLKRVYGANWNKLPSKNKCRTATLVVFFLIASFVPVANLIIAYIAVFHFDEYVTKTIEDWTALIDEELRKQR